MHLKSLNNPHNNNILVKYIQNLQECVHDWLLVIKAAAACSPYIAGSSGNDRLIHRHRTFLFFTEEFLPCYKVGASLQSIQRTFPIKWFNISKHSRILQRNSICNNDLNVWSNYILGNWTKTLEILFKNYSAITIFVKYFILWNPIKWK